MNFATLTSFVPVPVPSTPVWVQAASVSVAAGFPSPADDHQVERIELMSQLVKHPQATFYVRIQGDSMRDAGILDGSVVLVDKAIKPRHGHIIIAVVDGDFTCKRLHQSAGTMRLKPENPRLPGHRAEGRPDGRSLGRGRGDHPPTPGLIPHATAPPPPRRL